LFKFEPTASISATFITLFSGHFLTLFCCHFALIFKIKSYWATNSIFLFSRIYD